MADADFYPLEVDAYPYGHHWVSCGNDLLAPIGTSVLMNEMTPHTHCGKMAVDKFHFGS